MRVCGSKPSTYYFKRALCRAVLHQKVPKKFEVKRQKRAPAGSGQSSGSYFSWKLQGIPGFLPHKHDKCRICMVDKFGIYHGRGRRLRTLGLRFWRPPLYQLSYSPIFIFSPQTSIEVVDRQGLEPRTDRL